MTCAFLLHTNAQAGEILIDDFSTGQGLDDSYNQTIVDKVVDGVGKSNQVSGGGILGGYRDIYVEEVYNGQEKTSDDPTLGISAQVSGGRFTASLADLVKGYAVVTYDGSNEVGDNWKDNVDIDGLGGEDWTGTTGFLFEAVSNDVIAPVLLIVWTDDDDGVEGNFVKHVLDFSTFGDINDEGLYDALIPVAWFSDAGIINWASVGAFQAIFNLDNTLDPASGEISVDLSLGRATAVMVPEPAALSMFGAGILMLGFMGTRRRNNKEQ